MTAPTHSACLTFDFDAMSSWITSVGSNNPSMISRGEFGTIGLDRVLRLLEKHDGRATFFVPGHTAWAWPDLVKRIYVDVAPALHPVAALSVESHLKKLAREHRAHEERLPAKPSRWTLR